MNRLEQIAGFHRLPPDRQAWLHGLAAAHGLSFQQLRFLVEYSLDMICWDQGGLDRFYLPGVLGKDPVLPAQHPGCGVAVRI